MKSRFLHQVINSLMIVLTLVWPIVQPLQLTAADFYWDTDTSTVGNDAYSGTGLGGNGTWDTGTSNWWDLAALTMWPNATDRAIFTGPAGGGTHSVSVDPGISANALSFLRSGYTLTGGNLTLAGANAGLYSAYSESATIDTEILGSAGLVKTGGGSIRLTNVANAYTGTTSIQGGSLVISSEAALGGTGAVEIRSGNNVPSNVSQIGFTGGSLVLDGTSSGFTFSRDINFEGRGPNGDRSSAILSLGNNVLSGNLTAGSSPLVPATARNSRINTVNGTLGITGTLHTGANSVVGTFTSLGGINAAGVGAFDLSGVLTGNGSIEKSGSGTLLLNPSSNTGYLGTVRVGGSSAGGQQSSVRVTQAAVGGASIFGGNNVGTGSASAIDLNGGVLEFRSEGDLNIGGFATGKNVYQRASSTVYTGPAVGGEGVNGLTTLGAYHTASNLTNTFNSRNGYGVTFGAWTQENTGNNNTLTNNMGGVLTFTGNAWNNTDADARTLTVGGGGVTQITGSITANGTNKAITKNDAGLLSIVGTASTLTGNIAVNGGALSITDFRSVNNGNAQRISIGSGTTSAALIIGGGTNSAVGLNATTKVINLAGSTGGASILANQGSNPVLINSNILATGGNATQAKTLILGGSSTQANRFNGNITNNAAGGTVNLQKTGTGIWGLNGNNTYTGTTTIQGGTLRVIANAAASNVIPQAATNTVVFSANGTTGASGGTLEFTGFPSAVTTETLGNLTLTGGANTIRVVGQSAAANLTFTGLAAVNNAASANFDITNIVGGNVTLTGQVATTATTLPGSGRLYVNGSDFAAINASAQVVVPAYGGAGNFRDAAGAFVAATHNRLTSSFSGSGSVSSLNTNSQTLTLVGNLNSTLGAYIQSGGNATIVSDSGTARLLVAGAAGTNTGFRVNGINDTLTVGTTANPVNIGSVMTGGLNKNGAGTLIFGGTNAQSGGVNINEGTVRLSGSLARLAANNGALAIRQGAALQLDGVGSGNLIFSTLDGAGTITNINATPTTFSQQAGGTWMGSFNDGAGVLSVTKTGAAATWSGNSSYSGITTIGGGVVTVDRLANGGVASGIGNSTNVATNLVLNDLGGLTYRGNDFADATVIRSRSTSTDRLFTMNGNASISSDATNNNAVVWSSTGAIVQGGVLSNRTFTLGGASTGDNTFNPQLTNPSGFSLNVTKTGAGQWNLGSNSSNYDGITRIDNGVLALNNAAALPANSPLVISAATTAGTLQTSGVFARNLTTTPTAGAGTLTFGGNATTGGGFAAHSAPLTVTLNGGAGLTWASGGFVTGALNLGSATALSDVTLTNDIDLAGLSRSFNVVDNGNTATEFATLTGNVSNGGVIKDGAGVLRLLGANTYAGTTNVNNGTIVATSLGSSTSGPTSSVGAGGVAMDDTNAIILGSGNNSTALQYIGSGETSDRKIRFNTTTQTQQIHADGTGPLVLTNVIHDLAVGDKTLALRGTNTGANIIGSALTDFSGGLFDVAVDGAATWILNNPGNTYSGGTVASSGALGIGDDLALGAGGLVITNGAVFAYGADRSVANPLVLSNNASSGFQGDHSLTFTGLTSLNISNANQNHTTNNSIAANRALTLSGGIQANLLPNATRVWTIDGPGETVISSTFTSNSSGLGIQKLGDGILTLGTDGVNSNWNRVNNAVDVDRGTLRFSVNDAIPTTFTANTSATTALNANTTTYVIGSTANLVVGQSFSGTNVPAGSIVATIVDGTTFTANQVSTGNVNAGVNLSFANSGGVTLTPELVTGDVAMLDLNGTNQTITSLTATTDGTAIIDNKSSTPATLTVGATNAATSFGTGIGTYSVTQTGSGALSLAKIGTGTANFTGTLGYNGTTTSSGGVLNLNSAASTTAVVAQTGGTLNLKGGLTVASDLASVTVDTNGLLSFASGVGTPMSNLTTLNLGATGTASLELDAGDSGTDTLTVLNPATVGAQTINLLIKDIDLSDSTTYNLLVAPSGLTAAGPTYVLNLPGYSGSFLTTADGLVQLTTGTLITTDVYWNDGTGVGGGTLTSMWNTVDPITTNINFSSDVAGNTTLMTNANLPGKGQKVIFQADNMTGGAPLATTLEQGFTINALEFRPSGNATDTSRTISIAPGAVSSNSLTVKPSVSTNGINLMSNASGTVTISAPYVAGTAQTWTVGDAPVSIFGTITTNTTNLVIGNTTGLTPGMTVTGAGIPAGATVVSIGSGNFTISANATASGNATNVFAAQQLNMSGAVTGNASVVKDGPGKVVLGVTGGFTGNYTNNAGITQVNAVGALGGLVASPGTGSDVTITGGSFYYNNATAGTMVNDIILNGGTLSAGGNNQTYSGNVSVAANSNINLREQASVGGNFTTTARNVTLSGVVSGNQSISLDSVITATAGNQLSGTLTVNNANSTWNGPLNLSRGTVVFTNVANAGNATAYVNYDGNISYDLFGRVINRNLDGATLNRNATINFATDSLGEFSVDNLSAGLTSNFTVNQIGAMTTGANSTVRFNLADVASNLNINGGIVLGGNTSITVNGGDADSLVTIAGTGISGTGELAINDEKGVWNVTSTRLHINAPSTFAGNTSLNEGILILGNSTALSSGSLTITGVGSTLQASTDLSGANAIANPTTLSANLTVSGANNVELSGAFTGIGGDLNRILTNSLTSPAALTISGNVSLGAAGNTAARTLTLSGSTTPTTISGVISDGNGFANNIVKSGNNTLNLTNTNTYSGNTTLTSTSAANGIIAVSANNALGTGTAIITQNAGLANIGQVRVSGGVTLANNWQVSGAGSDGTTDGLLRSLSGTNVLNGNLTVIGGGGSATLRADAGSLLVVNGNVTHNQASARGPVLVGAGDFEFNGPMSDNGAVALTLDSGNTGTTTLSGANTYTGSTTVRAGLLTTNANDAIPDGSAILVGGAASASMLLGANRNDTIGNLTLGSAAGTAASVSQAGTQAGSGVLTLAGNVTTNATGNPTASASLVGSVALGAGTRTFNVANSTGSAIDLDVSAAVSGSGDLTKTGAGTLSLSGAGANTFSGLTTIAAGEVQLNKTPGVNAIIGDGISLKNIPDVVVSGGTLNWVGANQLDDSVYISQSGGTINFTQDETLYYLDVSGGSTNFTSGEIVIEDPTWSGGVVSIATSMTVGSQFQIANHTPGVNTYTVTPTGILTIGTAGTPNGPLEFGGANNDARMTVDGTVRFRNGSTPSLNFVGTGTSAGTIEGSGTLNFNGTMASFNIDDAVGSPVDMTIATSIVNSTGTGGFDKTGAGTLLLTGTNTYNGSTLVSNGTLIVNGDNSVATGAVTVDPIATLSGNGIIGGATTISGNHSVGANPTSSSADIQTFNAALDYTTGSTFVWDLLSNGNATLDRGTQYDGVDLTSSALSFSATGANSELRFDAGSVLWADPFWDNDRTWLVFSGASSLSNLLDNTGVIVGNDSNAIPFATGRPTGLFAWSFNGNDVYLNYLTAVPEPASLGGATVLFGSWVIRRRMKRNKKATA